MQVEEELVAPACCSGVGLGGKGNEDRDRFTKRGAEEGLPEGEVPAVRVCRGPILPRKPRGTHRSVRGCAFSSSDSNARISSRKAEMSSVAAIFCGQ